MSATSAEVRKLTGLALPVVAAQVGSMLMGIVDSLMVSRLGVDALAAVSLGGAWIFAALLFGQGFVHGIDPIITRAHGARDGDAIGRALQQGIVVALAISVPLCVLLFFTGDFLLAIGQSPELAAVAQSYAVVQVPSVPFFLTFLALRQYLQGREMMRPAMWVILVANVFNVAANYLLIFGGLGIPALGVVGAGIATSVTRGFTLFGLIALVWGAKLHRGAWVRWSAEAFDLKSLFSVVSMGFPIAIQMSLEIWAFSVSTLFAGYLGATALAAHHIVLNLSAISYMTSLGVAQGAVTRVGNLLGARDSAGAQRAAWVAIAMGAGVMTVWALLFVTLRNWLPRIWLPDDTITIALAASILPIAAAFQVFDGTQAVCCGVLRGMGRTRPAAVFNFFGYWVIALPLAFFLVKKTDTGLPGIWWPLALGLAIVAIALVVWIAVRGPNTLPVGPTVSGTEGS